MQLKPNFVPINNLKSKRTAKYKISEANVGIVMNILRNQLYSNKILAVIREYLTNAADEHAETKNKSKAINITLPTAINPDFVIRDFGRGLCRSAVEKTYIILGESTKRNTNKLTGCLGLGSKAGFAYSDSFSIISYHKGQKTTYLAFIDESNEGRLVEAAKEKTSETGMEIRIPTLAEDRHDFEHTLREFLTTFSAKVEVTPKIDIPKYPSNREVIIMGNVAYPYDGYKCNVPSGNSLLLHLPIGSVDITASRESLEYTEKTKQAIKEAAEIELEHIWGEFTAKIDSKDSWFDAVRFAYKLRHKSNLPSKAMCEKHRRLDMKEFTYKGTVLSEQFFSHNNSREITPFAELNSDGVTWEHSDKAVDANSTLLLNKPVYIYKQAEGHGRWQALRYGQQTSPNNVERYLLEQVRELCKKNKVSSIVVCLFESTSNIFNVAQELLPENLIRFIPTAPTTETVKTSTKKRVKKTPVQPTHNICFKLQTSWKKGKPITVDRQIKNVYMLRSDLTGYRCQANALEKIATLKKLIGKFDVFIVDKKVPEWAHLSDFIVDKLNALGFSEEVLAYFYIGDTEYDQILKAAKYKKGSAKIQTIAAKQQKAINIAKRKLAKRNCSIREFAEILPNKKNSFRYKSSGVCPILVRYPLMAYFSYYSYCYDEATFNNHIAEYSKMVDREIDL